MCNHKRADVFKRVTLRDCRFVKDAKNNIGTHTNALSPSLLPLPFIHLCPLVFQAIYLCIQSMKCEMRDYRGCSSHDATVRVPFYRHQFDLSIYHVLCTRETLQRPHYFTTFIWTSLVAALFFQEGFLKICKNCSDINMLS